mmetsp:Transcript_60260/g.141959  ORF Transcript_60260/g.141959 Transcript_60260/m.141959 type:complete len:270 (+) Transcript_60260:56-865(+)
MVPKTRAAAAPVSAASRAVKPRAGIAKDRSPKRSSKHLSTFFRNYKCSGPDIDPLHFGLLQAVTALIGLSPSHTVLYPGCHRHITPSLFYPSVTYVDNYAKLREFYLDPAVYTWVQENKKSPEPAKMLYACQNFEKPLPAKFGGLQSFDLMISASAGIISTVCYDYLKQGDGYLLVSDAHFDAKEAFLHPEIYEPVAFWDRNSLQRDTTRFNEFFLVATKGDKSKEAKPITMAQLEECKSGKPRSKWSFNESAGSKEQSRPLFFLFRRR